VEDEAWAVNSATEKSSGTKQTKLSRTHLNIAMEPLHILIQLLTDRIRLALQYGGHALERHSIVSALDL
jgi:hypothetical protein